MASPLNGMNNSLNRYGAAIGIPILVLLVLLTTSFTAIGPGERGVRMTFGKPSPTVLDPGIHMKIPLIQTIKHMDVRIQKSEASQTAASKDLQDVKTQVAVNWSINPVDAEWVYQHVGNEEALVNKVITPTIANVVKAVTAKYDAEELISKREEIRALMEKQITAGVAPFKIQVQGVNITNFSFSSQFIEAIEKKQVAQQRALQATFDLQRIKVEAQQKVAEAQGQSESQKLLQATLTPEIIRLNAVQKWDGVLPKVVGGNGVIPFIGDVSGDKPPH